MITQFNVTALCAVRKVSFYWFNLFPLWKTTFTCYQMHWHCMMPFSEPWLSIILGYTLIHSFSPFPPVIDFEYNTGIDADPRTKCSAKLTGWESQKNLSIYIYINHCRITSFYCFHINYGKIWVRELFKITFFKKNLCSICIYMMEHWF